jgi:hypothetical protein
MPGDDVERELLSPLILRSATSAFTRVSIQKGAHLEG